MKVFAAALFALAATSSIAALPHAQGSCVDGSYRVVRGDTLYSIARLCRSSVTELVRLNRLDSPTRIEPEQVLRLREGADVPVPESQAVYDYYRIEAGDTLYSLARRTRVSLAALMAANPGIDPLTLEIGDIVRLPGRGEPRALPPADEPDEEAKPDEEEREPEGM